MHGEYSPVNVLSERTPSVAQHVYSLSAEHCFRLYVITQYRTNASEIAHLVRIVCSGLKSVSEKRKGVSAEFDNFINLSSPTDLTRPTWPSHHDLLNHDTDWRMFFAV